MNAFPAILRIRSALLLTATVMVFSAARLIVAEQPPPVLLLGNRENRCDAVSPDDPSHSAPLYFVPQNRLEHAPALPAPLVEPPKQPEPASKSGRVSLPRPELNEKHSSNRTDRLNRLSDLLGVLREKLDRAPPVTPATEEPLPNSEVSAKSTSDAEPPATNEPASTSKSANAARTNPSPSDLAAVDEPTPTHPPLVPAPIEPTTQEMAYPLPAVPVVETETVSHGPSQPDESTPDAGHQPAQSDSKTWILNTTVGAPVNRMALANNLYAAGETELALDVYAEIDLQTLEGADQHWVLMQLANCYRRLGNLSEAAKHYRKTSSVEDPPWMGEFSRWWLKAIDTRTSVMQRSQEFESRLTSLKELMNAERKP